MAETRENKAENAAAPPATAATPTGDGADVRQKAGAVAEQAGSAATEVKDHATGAALEVKDRALTEMGNLQGEAREQARNLTHEVRDQLGGRADDLTHQVAAVVADARDELRSMANGSDQPDGPMTGMVRQLADGTDSLAQRLETGGYRGVADDVSRVGRNHPGLFLLAAGVAGFAVGRLLRNTDTRSLTDAVRDDPGARTSTPAPTGRDADIALDAPSGATYTPAVTPPGAQPVSPPVTQPVGGRM